MKIQHVVIIFLILIAGCSPALPINESTPLSAENNQTFTPFSVSTIIPIATLTPNVVTLTNLPPILTAFPTMSSLEGIKSLEVWFRGSNECFLPCWAGLITGKSDWEVTKQLIGSMSGFSTINVSENMDCDFGKCNGIGWSLFPEILVSGSLYVTFPENKLHVMTFDIQDGGNKTSNLLDVVSFRKLLNTYGTPSTILFFSEPDLPGQIFLEMTLVYPEKHFLARYSMYAEKEGDLIISCNRISYVTIIVVNNSDILRSIDSIINSVETKNIYIGAGHKTIEQVLQINNNAFYEIYRKEDAPCVVVPTSIWIP